MSVFDHLGGTKKFKKGMEAGAKPFIEKFTQHTEALNRLEKSFGKSWKETKEVADLCINKVDALDREKLYGLYSQYDIKDLEPEYKDFIIAVLYRLSSEKKNELQQSYIRSVKNYLDIKNPPTITDFSGIENIESLNAQKSLFQICVEYLLLGNSDASFFKQYEDCLFNFFSIKEKPMIEIWENVLQIYSAIGPLGLAEKYGFVPEVENKPLLLTKDYDMDLKKINVMFKHVPYELYAKYLDEFPKFNEFRSKPSYVMGKMVVGDDMTPYYNDASGLYARLSVEMQTLVDTEYAKEIGLQLPQQ